jgi:NADH:ubiquinone oxidoreductase subunit
LTLPPPARNRLRMGIFKNIFTWWEGATFGTALGTMTRGTKVGSDSLGNVYYRGGKQTNGNPRRWVIYSGSNDASRVPPEWHGWLHGATDLTPDELPPARSWEREPTPNLTGSDGAYLPPGASGDGSRRARATGDYQAWSPGEA